MTSQPRTPRDGRPALMRHNQRYYLVTANFVEAVHIVITLSTMAAMFLIFFSAQLRIYCAIWFCLMWVTWRIFGNCPLTVKEYELRLKAGEEVTTKNFIPRFFKKYFNLDIPDWMAELWGNIYFIISVYILLTNFD